MTLPVDSHTDPLINSEYVPISRMPFAWLDLQAESGAKFLCTLLMNLYPRDLGCVLILRLPWRCSWNRRLTHERFGLGGLPGDPLLGVGASLENSPHTVQDFAHALPLLAVFRRSPRWSGGGRCTHVSFYFSCLILLGCC